MDKWLIPEIDTFREKSFALSDALSDVMRVIQSKPSEECGYENCEDCPNYHKVSIRYRNYITEKNSIEPPKCKFYDEEDYGGYCKIKIKTVDN